MIKRLKDEAGYSLVEVIASIIILSIAIIPMVGMFDMGLNAATSSGNYDTARALAKKQMEKAQSLPYNKVAAEFPSSPDAGTSEEFNGSGLSVYTAQTDPDGLFSNYEYEVRKQYVVPNGSVFDDSSTDQGLMRITVSACWDNVCWDLDGNKTYTTGTLKAK
ncbi:MAG: hypothetical protein H0U02_03690 [Rubrobacter sp.]|nr:hypothetical protein [Rubrobacter sp.]MBA3790039.1 hypothetical protein [Rubrobacter sp.]